MTRPKITYSELERINKIVFKPCGLELTNVEAELESMEYSAHNFNLGGQKVKFRTAKITPTKTGLFVTLWKRDKNRIIVPFDISDNIDIYIIATRKEAKFGFFAFPKNILYENKILSDKNRDGKRGIRVYPSWHLTTNKQALKTQLWQTKYFFDISEEKQIDFKEVMKIL